MRPSQLSSAIVFGSTGRTRAAARLLVAAAVALLAAAPSALAQSAYCNDLKGRIANAGRNDGSSRYRAAAAKQQREIDRTAAFARSLGCDRQQFLFFGDPPPPQCRAINARLAHMQANLAGLQRGASGEGSREALIALYNARCSGATTVAARAPRARSFFEELFGVAPPDESGGLRQAPVEDPRRNDPSDGERPAGEDEDERPRGGSMAICVRKCDGGFFPVSYSARRSNLDQLDNLCKALCPNADAALYTKSPWRDVDNAVSIDGQSYSDLPNALKFQKTHDSACSCKPPDKSWADSLEDAERILSSENRRDIVINAEMAEQLSRPAAAGATHGRSRQKNFSSRQDAAAAPTDATSPLEADKAEATSGNAEEPRVYRDVVGPDGVKRRVRVVAPSL